jgi:hydroxyethylthiazole kinase-like uncharacterized protein yjeF
MQIPEINLIVVPTLPIGKFKEMDYLAVEKYHLDIEIMMENAGLNLARLATIFIPVNGKVLIGVGTGNNGGGGLVAARRLSAWGYNVFLHIPNTKLNKLPALQLERTLTFGAKISTIKQPDLFIDTYLGFSQRMPLESYYQEAIIEVNKLSCKKVSLDIPTGFDKETGTFLFKPDVILTLAAMKEELMGTFEWAEIFLADLGMSQGAYLEFGEQLPAEFKSSSLLKIIK